MKINSAKFNISYKRKEYSVDFIARPERNMTYSVLVTDHQGTGLGQYTVKGRQVVSLWNAGEIVKKCLRDKK